ncbi:MAG: formate-dependent phosphoribosylglycinamide formyltransferase [Mangrovibacterium sp.]
MQKKIMLLGSGELGKEFVIAAQRWGQTVIAVDSYAGAPAMQVADIAEVINMLNRDALDSIVAKHQPDLIVPEIEAIRTERFYDYEDQGIQIVPSAKAANFTMNRKAIRDMAAIDLGLKTARYHYAKTFEEFTAAIKKVGMPCVVKPLMSSSGKGQSIIKTIADINDAWKVATEKGRGDADEVIVEAFVPFINEVTLLTVTQKNGETLFCRPIGHRQERGDYQESWQPVNLPDGFEEKAQNMATKVTSALGGAGIWGVEFFITADDVVFNELSPRPHDTGMVTLAGTQNLNEFELHCRAVLGLPIVEIRQEKSGASAVILANKASTNPNYIGIEKVCENALADFRIFGKSEAREHRRMGVVLLQGELGEDVLKLQRESRILADKVSVE